MKSLLVIGLSRFGRHLSLKLAELGNEVMVVDRDECRVEHVAPYVTSAHVADCQEEEVLRAFGVSNFDVCFVCVSGDFQASLEITSMLKELGAAYVVAQSDREKQAKFLEKIGADDVIHAEKEMAYKVAVKYSAKNTFDYIELSQDYAIVEIRTPKEWVGRSISELKIRSKHNVNIIGYRNEEKRIIPILDAEHVFGTEEHLIIAGNTKDARHVALQA